MDTSIYERGLKRMGEMDSDVEKRVDRLVNINPDLGRYIIEFGFGEILSRPGLTLQQRELSTVAALTAMQSVTPQLKVHIAACLDIGISKTEITETIIQMAFYAGFPASLNGMLAAKEVFYEYDKKTSLSK